MKSFSNETLNFFFFLVLQCSKLFNSKVSSGFLRQDSQSSYSFGKIQNVVSPELSEENEVLYEKQFGFQAVHFSEKTLLHSSMAFYTVNHIALVDKLK